ncbi:hypothetical protein H8356DRAFT_1359880 [Neocallimastix lanati (nom. inval.)]|nr:hypothetical protein H8356DRAFT_1359880 [Neocallimastix sp. JGI-2020a]
MMIYQRFSHKLGWYNITLQEKGLPSYIGDVLDTSNINGTENLCHTHMINMGVCLTAIPILQLKKLQYRSTLCHPQGKAEPIIGAGNCNPYKAYAMGFLKY